MRARIAPALALVLVILGCKDKDAASPPPAPHQGSANAADAAVAPLIDWARCEATLREAPKVPSTRRVQHVLDGCMPCGDWRPLLRWDTLQVDGGPTRLQIEQAMLACNAYCEPNARQRFLGTLDAARSKGTRGPWRHLGEVCGAAVSAVPDARFMSAPFFALDRIARTAAARPALAPLVEALELPLPAISSTGSGISLASSPVTTPEAGPVALTVSTIELRIAATPRARLGKDGITVLAKGELYPGALVKTPAELAAALETVGATPSSPLSVFAPSGMAASRLLDVFPITLGHEVRLAAAAEGAPIGWNLAGTVPIVLSASHPKRGGPSIALTLGADPTPSIMDAKARATALASATVTIALDPGATVAGLTKLVGALVYFDVKRVALVTGSHPAAKP